MPQVPADVLAEVFSADNPLADVVAFEGAEIRCYVTRRYVEGMDGVDSQEIVASIPAPLPDGIANEKRLTYNGKAYKINSVRESDTEGIIDLVLAEVR